MAHKTPMLVVRCAVLLSLAAVIELFTDNTAARAEDAKPKPKPYRLKSTDLKQAIIWGSEATSPDGFALAFGGQNQKSDDGVGHTRIKEAGGQWREISAELRKANPQQPLADEGWALRERVKDMSAKVRTAFYEGVPLESWRTLERTTLKPEWDKLLDDCKKFGKKLEGMKLDEGRRRLAAPLYGIDCFLDQLQRSLESVQNKKFWSNLLENLSELQNILEQVAETFAAEPPPRALSPLVYEPQSKVFVLFGGDHLDFLLCDTWTFDPAARKWTWQKVMDAAPPRANHALQAKGDGTVVLRGGYTYANNYDYMGGQYIDLDDGEWTYRVGQSAWTSTKGAKQTPLGIRTYRTQAFAPLEFAEGQQPDAQKFAEFLAQLPANVWTKTKPGKLPQMQRDWGSAILDPDRDLILRWSGGHCAHGGTDVLHFHLKTNCWELTNPVEFPLGQLYTNTEYPDGFNFNRRPWVTGHTYQNYGYDVNLKRMLFAGRETHTYVYEPDRGDWGERMPKPAGLVYDGSFFTITCTSTPQGLIAWTAQGKLFQFDAKLKNWQEKKLSGEKLTGAVVDNSTILYDSKRDRLLACQKPYGDKTTYSGLFQAIDLKTGDVSTIAPANKAAGSGISYLCQLRYDPEHDLVLCGCTLEPGDGGVRRTPAYDCAANRWMSYKITGDDPSGPKGRNVSLGLVYDPARKLFWAVDTYGNIFVLRFDPTKAEGKELGG